LTAFVADIFGYSPVMPLETHADIAYRCAQELVGLFKAALANDWDDAQSIGATIGNLEHEANSLKREIRLHLSRSLLMPVPRTDLLALLSEQDKIANRAKDVSRLVIGRKMQIPSGIGDKLIQYVLRCVDTAKQARKCVSKLDELFTVGFKGAQVARVALMIDEIEQMETGTDDLQVELRAATYAVESELAPVNLMFLYCVIELIGETADAAKRVAHRLQLLLAH
jgi:uncharacterized protein